MMRDRLASLIVVKQEGGSNTSINHHQAAAIKCEAALYTHCESGLFQEINNNSCYRQNLNAPTHQQQAHTSHLQHAQQHQNTPATSPLAAASADFAFDLPLPQPLPRRGVIRVGIGSGIGAGNATGSGTGSGESIEGEGLPNGQSHAEISAAGVMILSAQALYFELRTHNGGRWRGMVDEVEEAQGDLINGPGHVGICRN
ncbi:GD21686 [Drosophila simulans]|uniref:GD21686 n=1 Tax=Drosophila simulans TaxID=7240 RepID=B4Q3G8_DROSI|nr:GD21686 [Drosophila simulans]